MRYKQGKDPASHRTLRRQVVHRAKGILALVHEQREAKGTHVVIFQEGFWVVVTVDVNLRDRIVKSRVLAPSLNSRLKPRKNQLQSVALLDFMYELGDGEMPVTDARRALIVLSSQSTSNKPPTTRGVRMELTLWTYTSMKLVRLFW